MDIHAAQLPANQSLLYLSLLRRYAVALLPHASVSDPVDDVLAVLLTRSFPPFQIHKARFVICGVNYHDGAHHMDYYRLLPRGA